MPACRATPSARSVPASRTPSGPAAASRYRQPVGDPSKPHPDVRWEAYAQARARGATILDAAFEAKIILDDHSPRTRRATDNMPGVRERIEYLLREGVSATRLTVQELLETFVAQATFDPVVFDGVESLADLKEKVPVAARRTLVKGWSYDPNGRFRLHLVDKEAALDRLARHLSFYRDVMRLEVVDYSEVLQAAKARRDAALEARDVTPPGDAQS